MDWGNPDAIREVTRVNYREAGFLLYPEEPGGPEGEEIPPPFCDAYFVEIGGPETPPEDPP